VVFAKLADTVANLRMLAGSREAQVP
jgi:hypothetical protein